MSAAPLSVAGQWWMPDRPDRKIAGTLTFSASFGGELALIGALRSIFEEGERTSENGIVTISIGDAAMRASGRYPRILGEAEGHVYTLDDCLRTNSTIRLAGQPSETIHVSRVLKGAIFEPNEPLEALAVSFGTHYLVDWVMESGISEQWAWREDDAPLAEEPRFRIEGREIPERSVMCPRGRTVRLKHRLGINGDNLTERGLSQGFS